MRDLLQRGRPGAGDTRAFEQRDELQPRRARALRDRLLRQQGTARGGRQQILQNPAGRFRPDTRQQLDGAESRHAIARILRPAQDG